MLERSRSPGTAAGRHPCSHYLRQQLDCFRRRAHRPGLHTVVRAPHALPVPRRGSGTGHPTGVIAGPHRGRPGGPPYPADMEGPAAQARVRRPVRSGPAPENGHARMSGFVGCYPRGVASPRTSPGPLSKGLSGTCSQPLVSSPNASSLRACVHAWRRTTLTTHADIGAPIAAAARDLNTEHSLEETLQAIVGAARNSVPGFDQEHRHPRFDRRPRRDSRLGPVQPRTSPCVDTLREPGVVVTAPRGRAATSAGPITCVPPSMQDCITSWP